MDKDEYKIPVTLNVMTYNQVKFAAAAVESALYQDYDGQLEVLITDDASTDGTAELLRDLVTAYDGHHSVRLIINRRNLGLIEHFNRVFALATHDFIVTSAGDDISRSDRVSRLASLQSRSGAWLLYSETDFMDRAGSPLPNPNISTTFSTDWTVTDVARSGAVFIGATAAYKKELLRSFGPIVERNAYEDLVMAFRAAIVGRIAYCDEPLVRYRVGEGISKAGTSEGVEKAHQFAVLLATLRQRLIDAKGFGLTFDDPVLVALREEISVVSSVLSDCRGPA
jgi:glycosyltransferase involved in cell wall biosynthesis